MKKFIISLLFLFICSYASAGQYEDIVVNCKVVADENGGYKLDLPFPIYHQEVVHKGKIIGCYPLTADLEGEDVIAVVKVSVEERTQEIDGKTVIAVPNSKSDAEKYEGLITDYQNDERVKEHWTQTKAETFISIDEDTEMVVMYDGEDKDELLEFYNSDALKVKTVEKEEISIDDGVSVDEISVDEVGVDDVVEVKEIFIK